MGTDDSANDFNHKNSNWTIWHSACLVIALMAGAVGLKAVVTSRIAEHQNLCINNLRLLDSAKEQYALENRKKPGDIVTADELRAYVGCGGELPFCPDDKSGEFTNSYELNPVGYLPTCKLMPRNHQLPPEVSEQ
jgi:hypothetical protein